FMQTKRDARNLAKAMVALGRKCGVNTRAMLTDMNTPLGRAAGNWLEIKESVACLEGLLPLPAKRGEGWGEGPTKRSSSPRPSPPLHGGEGEVSDLRFLV